MRDVYYASDIWGEARAASKANMPPCLIGMKACLGAHHLSRKLRHLRSTDAGKICVSVFEATRRGPRQDEIRWGSVFPAHAKTGDPMVR